MLPVLGLLCSCDFVEAHCYVVTISELISMSICAESISRNWMWLIKAIVPETSSNQLLLIDSAT